MRSRPSRPLPRRLALAAAAWLLAVLPLAAGDATAPALAGDLADARFGRLLAGPPPQPAGRWTVVAFWGWRCPLCIASFAELSRMARRPEVALIAVHATPASDEEIRESWIAHGGSERASVLADGTVLGRTRPPLPAVLVFDPAGALAYDGNPYEAERRLPSLIAVGSATAAAARP